MYLLAHFFLILATGMTMERPSQETWILIFLSFLFPQPLCRDIPTEAFSSHLCNLSYMLSSLDSITLSHHILTRAHCSEYSQV